MGTQRAYPRSTPTGFKLISKPSHLYEDVRGTVNPLLCTSASYFRTTISQSSEPVAQTLGQQINLGTLLFAEMSGNYLQSPKPLLCKIMKITRIMKFLIV